MCVRCHHPRRATETPHTHKHTSSRLRHLRVVLDRAARAPVAHGRRVARDPKLMTEHMAASSERSGEETGRAGRARRLGWGWVWVGASGKAATTEGENGTQNETKRNETNQTSEVRETREQTLRAREHSDAAEQFITLHSLVQCITVHYCIAPGQSSSRRIGTFRCRSRSSPSALPPRRRGRARARGSAPRHGSYFPL